MMRWMSVGLASLSVLLAGCSADDSAGSKPGDDPGATGEPVEQPATGEDPVEEPTTGEDPVEEPTYDPAQWFTWNVGEYELPAGEERFLCFTLTLDEDLATDTIVIESRPTVHHAVMSRTMSPDPEEPYECDVLFQTNWIPLFVSGTGEAKLQTPEGSGHVLPKGTQLTVQLHLLNASPVDVTDSVPFHMRRLDGIANVDPVEVVVFGSMAVDLQPKSPGQVVGDCGSDSDMKIFAAFPHMHLLGRSMTVEVENDAGALEKIFERDPYDFDDQYFEPVELDLKQGDRVKVTCNYQNDLDQVVDFGESTTSEMCFWIGFATGVNEPLSGCIGGGGAGLEGLIPEACGTDPANEIGLGEHCTAGGGECAAGLTCIDDMGFVEGIETCIKVGCQAQADCGEGGVCCSISQAGGFTMCLPPSCNLGICSALP